MSNIVYGVSGEGAGHSSRAAVIAGHLESLGHTVKIVTYDRGLLNLQTRFDVFATEGLHICSIDNKVSKRRTLKDNLQRLPDGHRKLTALKETVFKGFAPDLVFTDFEPMTAYLANHYDLPLVTVDNQHRLRYMHFPCPPELRKDRVLTRNIIRSMIPRPDVSLVTTFYFGDTRNERTFLFPPILREEVLALKPGYQEHILVYLTSGFESFVDMLRDFPRERFIVYGQGDARTEANLSFRKPSRDGFLADLAGCKAVMATAGYTLITEALFLRKPYLALPMRGQFEQEINAFFLARLGFGQTLSTPSPTAIAGFLYRLPDFKARLEEYQAQDNTAILEMADRLAAGGGALARDFHRRRARG